jgi:hypothetical protein
MRMRMLRACVRAGLIDWFGLFVCLFVVVCLVLSFVSVCRAVRICFDTIPLNLYYCNATLLWLVAMGWGGWDGVGWDGWDGVVWMGWCGMDGMVWDGWDGVGWMGWDDVGWM